MGGEEQASQVLPLQKKKRFNSAEGGVTKSSGVILTRE